MPIGLDDTGTKRSAFCDFCGNFCHFVNDAWLHHNGFDVGKPKIDIACTPCWLGYLQGGIQIKGYGTVSATEVQKVKEAKAEAAAKSRRTKVTVEDLNQKINWAGIEASIKAGTFKVNKTAEELNANPVELRSLVEDHFAVRDTTGTVTGSQIKFVRGRKGGVYWNG